MISSNVRSCQPTRTPISFEGLGLQKMQMVSGDARRQALHYRSILYLHESGVSAHTTWNSVNEYPCASTSETRTNRQTF